MDIAKKLQKIQRMSYREDACLIFDVERSVYHRLENQVAKDFFSFSRKAKGIEDVVTNICQKYDVDENVARLDIERWIDTLFTDCDESSWYGVDKGFGKALEFPIRLEIELTALCNWNCGFCYNVWKLDGTPSEIRRQVQKLPNKNMSYDLAKSIIDECVDKGCMVVRYSGGETMLHPRFMDIIEYGGKKGLHQVVFTNGHFIDKSVAAQLAKNNVKTVLISMHGDEDIHNSLCGNRKAYQKALNAMISCLNEGIEVVAEMTLVQKNSDVISSIMRDVYDVGVRQFQIMRYVATGKDDDVYEVEQERMLGLMKQVATALQYLPDMRVGWPCGQKFCTSDIDAPLESDDSSLVLRNQQLTGHCEAGLVWGSVSFDGKMRTCPHSDVYFGSLEESNIQSCWETISERVMSAVRPRETCGTCAKLDVCKGGCHLGSFTQKAANIEQSSVTIINLS